MLHIREIAPTRRALMDFVRFPLTLYAKDARYVPIPPWEQASALLGRHNALRANGVQCFLMAYDGQRPVGRLLAGIDFRAMRQGDEKPAYLSLFECEDNQAAADLLFDAAKAFLKGNGATVVIGPNPALYGEFGVGLLAEGFDQAPMYLSPYNPPYYPRLFEAYGFTTYHNHFAYEMPMDRLPDARYESVLARAGKRFGYRVENVNLRTDLKRRTRQIARVVAESMPPPWEALPPTYETLYRTFKHIQLGLWPDYTLMAFAGDRPVGVLIAMPDMNAVMRGLAGRIFPIGTFRMIFLRSYLRRVRTAMLYVVPEYQNKGVEAVMAHRALEAARRSGIQYAEASMVDERNLKLQLGIDKLGGKVTKVFRQYRMEL
jgi:GNAT superfamily N-acetyltransferase